MSTSGENAVKEIQADLACPQCQYNLRGLRGPDVHCPECGLAINVAKLIASQWKGSWWTVPRLKAVESPTILAAAAGLFLGVVAQKATSQNTDPEVLLICAVVGGIITLLWLASLLTLWLRTRRWAYVRLSLQSLWFAPAWYALAVLPLMGVGILAAGLGTGALLQAVSGAMLLIVAAVVFWACRLGDRWLAERCLRLHLAAQAGAASTDQSAPPKR